MFVRDLKIFQSDLNFLYPHVSVEIFTRSNWRFLVSFKVTTAIQECSNWPWWITSLAHEVKMRTRYLQTVAVWVRVFVKGNIVHMSILIRFFLVSLVISLNAWQNLDRSGIYSGSISILLFLKFPTNKCSLLGWKISRNKKKNWYFGNFDKSKSRNTASGSWFGQKYVN